VETVSSSTRYLRPTAPIAADLLLIGDPATAMALAQEVVEAPAMANHAYGLWGYSGRTANGLELTVQATGIGGPSAALVLAELAAHGARRAIRVGSARSLDPALTPGDVVIASAAIGGDGTSRALGLREPALPDPDLTASLVRACGADARLAPLGSADLDLGAAPADALAGAAALDLETAPLLAAGRRAGIAVAVVALIADPAAGGAAGPDRELIALGAACARALADQSPSASR
jgi:uridine phosphorylase